jgi:hypothetical protein
MRIDPTRRPHRRTRIAGIVVMCVTAAIVATGCGESVAEKTFGGMSSGDVASYEAVATNVGAFSKSYTDLTVAFQGNDAESMRTAVTAMDAAIAKADTGVAKFENPNLKTTFGSYLETLHGFSEKATEVVTSVEAGGTGDDEADQALLVEFNDAIAVVQTADADLNKRLMANATPEERKQLQASIDEQEKDFQEATQESK